MLCEIPSGAVDVKMNLVVELERRSELPLAPQQLVEIKPHDVAVHVRLEIENVTLDRNRVILVQRRPDADVGDALETTRETLEARCGDVDAAAGVQLVGRIDIHRRKSDLAPEPPAGRDAAVDEIGAAEEQGGGAHGAFADRIAEDRARDADAAHADFVDALHRKTELRAGFFEFREIAFAPRAEAEVARVRVRYGLARPYVLSVGTVSGRKNLGLLASGARALADRGMELLGAPGPATTAAPAPAPDEVAEYPLSFGQRSIWYAQQLAPGGAAYHLNGAANPQDESVSIAARALTGADYHGHVF